jgi:uncharacterized protein YxeA
MIFEIDDLQMWLEDVVKMPQAYWNAVEAGTDREYLAQWLGYESVDEMEKYEMTIEYKEESYNEDGYTNTTSYPTSHISNPPTKMDMELYYKWINSATQVAADEY